MLYDSWMRLKVGAQKSMKKKRKVIQLSIVNYLQIILINMYYLFIPS